MSKNQNRIVFRTNDGKWANKRCDAQKTASKHNTQKEAREAAKNILKNGK